MSTGRINTLHIENYRSFHQAMIELRPLNILIGPNGAGKSNLLSFFELLQQGANGQFAAAIRKMEGLNELRWKGVQNGDIGFTIEFENLAEIDRVQERAYELVLASVGNSFTISRESISRRPFPDHGDPYYYLWAREGRLRFLKARPDAEAEEESDPQQTLDDHELVLFQLRDPRRLSVIDELRGLLSDWGIYRGFGQDVLDAIRQAQLLEVVEPLRIDPSGRNLVSVLHTICNETRYYDTKQALYDTLKAAFPDFVELNFPVIGSGRVELRWQSRAFERPQSFSTQQISDGMLRFLGLATVLLLPEPPPLIAIDEPEVGLHYGLLPLLAGLLKKASDRSQIVVTTHSPSLLDAEGIEVDDILLVSNRSGETLLQRADSLQNLNRWLERYTLGQLWKLGKLQSA